jgi:nicotinic acid mononucleotide adenylyltransferase
MTAIEVPAVDISAAMIRVALASGKTIDRQVPVAIAQYIEEHELYE